MLKFLQATNIYLVGQYSNFRFWKLSGYTLW